MRRTIALLLFCVAFAAAAGIAPAAGVEIFQDEIHETYEADGAALATLDAVFPRLAGMANPEAIERVNAAIRAHILTKGEYDNIRGYALDDFTNAPERFAENVYGLTANAEAELLQGNTLLAVRYDFLLETGGPHPWDVISAQHFDLSSGMPAALETLTHDPEALRARVAAWALRWIDENEFDAFDDVEARALEWPLENGLLTGEGLVAFYNEGELGPVSEGAAEVFISYASLFDLLSSGLMHTRAVSVAYAAPGAA